MAKKVTGYIKLQIPAGKDLRYARRRRGAGGHGVGGVLQIREI